MQAWLPVPGTTSGRLVEAALELFGAAGFESVQVGVLAARAGVTTGSLYHHFGSKAGLYRLVRADVEQRVLDRIEGAAATRTTRRPADLVPALLVGFDFLTDSGYARLLAEPNPDTGGRDLVEDPVAGALDRLLPDGPPVGGLLAATWRAALWRATENPGRCAEVRAGFVRLLTDSGPAASPSASP